MTHWRRRKVMMADVLAAPVAAWVAHKRLQRRNAVMPGEAAAVGPPPAAHAVDVGPEK